MSDLVEVPADRAQSLKTIGHISYLLHTLVAVSAVVPFLHFGVGLLVVAFIIDIVKRADAAGTWQESHFAWRIRSVIWVAVLYAVTFPLFLFFYVPGWIAWTIISIWFLYRVVRGWVALNDNRPMPT